MDPSEFSLGTQSGPRAAWWAPPASAVGEAKSWKSHREWGSSEPDGVSDGSRDLFCRIGGPGGDPGGLGTSGGICPAFCLCFDGARVSNASQRSFFRLPDAPPQSLPVRDPGFPGRREKLAYGLGNAASCLYWQTIMAYLTFFYTDVFGISAAAAGAMIGLSRGMDAFFDPVMGMLADRAHTRWGRFRPFLLWFCLPLGIMGVLTFTVPSLGASAKLVWAYATYNALMLIYTAINIPYI